ncbi:MAG: S8 family peptidase [Bacteroidetes bacterium]|nr:S8 family peptidase [Bacteroidota bacterium]
MRNRILLVLFTCLQLLGNAQVPFVDPLFASRLKSPQSAITPCYKKGNITFISAFVQTNSSFQEKDFTRLGIKTGTQIGNIRTVLIPETSAAEFLKLKGVDRVEADQYIHHNMAEAKKALRLDSVAQAINLKLPYTGKNVVVGIIDAGFDYTHPAFRDTSGSNLRVKRVWEQRNSGIPPQGYAYGNELKDSESIITKGFEVASFSHGTHVAGIASGSGLGSTKNRGIAYESELVFVGIRPEKSEWTGMGMSSIIDAVNYIFTYASSVGKPAVANLSWGCSIGPNDGSSLFAKALDGLTGRGKIFINSAGNNGDENIHLYKAFSESDTAVYTFANLPQVAGEKRSWIDIWADAGTDKKAVVRLYSGITLLSELVIPDFSTQFPDTFLIGANNDTCYFSAFGVANDPANSKAHLLFNFFNKTGNSICIGLMGKSGAAHMWMGYVEQYNGYYGNFSNGGQSFASKGDSRYTLGEMSCTRSAITVAAYASKVSFKNLGNTTQSYSGYAKLGQIVPFSSIGPTADGRMKPDVAAPGLTIASAVNSYDVSYAPGGSNYVQSVVKYSDPQNSRDYFYAEASGTSMSSPMVCGVVALMLQQNPFLNPEEIKHLFKATRLVDAATGANPDSTRWGVGKLNAYALLKACEAFTGNPKISKKPEGLQVYPNPTQTGSITLQNSGSEKVWVELFTLEGKLLETLLLPSGENLNWLAPGAGIFIAHFNNADGGIWVERLIVQ